MIDDSIATCSDCLENGVNALLMNTSYNKHADIPRVYNWNEIYEYINKYNLKRKYKLFFYVKNVYNCTFKFKYIVKLL